MLLLLMLLMLSCSSHAACLCRGSQVAVEARHHVCGQRRRRHHARHAAPGKVSTCPGWLARHTAPERAAMLVATALLHAVLPRRPGRAARLPVGGSSRTLTAWFPSLSSCSLVGAMLTWCAASLTCCQLCRSHFCRLQDM